MTAPPIDPYEKPCTCRNCVEQPPEEGRLQKLWRQRDRGFETFALQASTSRTRPPRLESRLDARVAA